VSTNDRPITINLNLDEIAPALERAQGLLPPNDFALMAGMHETLLQTWKLLIERGATIARLRRLYGWTNNEKLAAVFGGSSSNATESDDAGSDGSDGARAADDTTEPSDEGEPADGDADQPDDGEERRAKGHGRIPASAYPNADAHTVRHEKLHAGDVCPDCSCGKLHPMSEPARIIRIFGQAPLAAVCHDCERLRCGGCGKVFTARAPAEAQGPKYADSAAAMIALLHYGTGMPFNRLAHLQSNMQTPVPATTQWEVVRDHADALLPVFDELKRRAADGEVLHNDDTYVRILDLMGQRRAELLKAGTLEAPERTGLFTTAVVSKTDDGPVALFFTGRQHAGENLDDLLDERDVERDAPILMCDGLSRNTPGNHDVVLSNCTAHGRRHIVDEANNFPAQCRHVLEQLAIVFRNEATAKKLGLTPEQRLELHQRDSRPVMDALKRWLEEQFEHTRVEPNSGLGQAYRYLLVRWDPLTLFLRVPGAPLDNNICERVLKMAIRLRNASLFYKSLRGASVGDLYMSLIFTAEMNGENSFEYLLALFEHESHVAETPSAWLPWTFRASLAARPAPQRAPPLGKRAAPAASTPNTFVASPASP
jgi:transposase